MVEPQKWQIAKGLRDYPTPSVAVKQLPIAAFAEALEIVPKTLAENAGIDQIDALVDMRAAQEQSFYMGLDVFQRDVVDMKEAHVIEPKRVKKQAIHLLPKQQK